MPITMTLNWNPTWVSLPISGLSWDATDDATNRIRGILVGIVDIPVSSVLTGELDGVTPNELAAFYSDTT
jgi:hypothetical protein